ncbi:ABC transporter ATP-binding protein [Rhodopirellula sp. JC740]|uniref:ABC transporter ATP-binding protein n=1 Tax=Rhodopirellula halodulae TaxID=2894198 RepID=A0ABS8NKN6_9BACT|nr:ABC transporter ATP-binding protein [Rhodopirellula sp. JC740]MCC9644127.1 ABC transporter ATP-binding protein [Rhodopirellula sp. JC740]
MSEVNAMRRETIESDQYRDEVSHSTDRGGVEGNASHTHDIIRVDRVSKRFGNKVALHGVSLNVPAGKVFALLGENGAGKTTLIRILTGFQKPDDGSASILGHDCGNNSEEIRRRIGYVSDAPALYEWMTPPEIGWFVSAFYDEGFIPRYRELIEEFQVPAGTKIKSMSKGQRAKVALALATAHDPELLILDEPTSGLDPMVRRQFLESMVDRAAEGRTVLLSSHHINEVERVADMVAIVHGGEVKLVQSMADLKEHTRIVTATMDDAHVESPDLPGRVLSETSNGRQRRWVITDWQHAGDLHWDESHGVRQFHVSVPTLEEVFIAVCGQPISDERSASSLRPEVNHGHSIG